MINRKYASPGRSTNTPMFVSIIQVFSDQLGRGIIERFAALPPGPLYMYFDSRNQQLNQPQSDNLGFDFDYELIYNDDDDCEISQNLGQNSP